MADSVTKRRWNEWCPAEGLNPTFTREHYRPSVCISRAQSRMREFDDPEPYSLQRFTAISGVQQSQLNCSFEWMYFGQVIYTFKHQQRTSCITILYRARLQSGDAFEGLHPSSLLRFWDLNAYIGCQSLIQLAGGNYAHSNGLLGDLLHFLHRFCWYSGGRTDISLLLYARLYVAIAGQQDC